MTKNLDREFLDNRLETLKRFLVSCLDHPVLRTSEALDMFLRQDDADKFIKKKLSFQNEKPFYHFLTTAYKEKDFTEEFQFVGIPTVSGLMRSQASDKLKNYSVEVEKTLTEQKTSYVKIKENVVKACQEMETVAQTLEVIEKELKVLEKSSNDFISKLHSNGSPSDWTYGWGDLANNHRSLSEVFSGLKWQMEGLKRSLKGTLYPEIKYSKKECEAGIEVIKYRNQSAQAYFAAYDGLKKKKDQLIATGDKTKWSLPTEASKYTKDELMKEQSAVRYHLMSTAAEAKTLRQMKHSFGYLNMNMVKEISNSMIRKSRRELKSICGFCTERVELLNQDTQKMEASLSLSCKQLEEVTQTVRRLSAFE